MGRPYFPRPTDISDSHPTKSEAHTELPFGIREIFHEPGYPEQPYHGARYYVLLAALVVAAGLLFGLVGLSHRVKCC